jgi:hypothetical protein
VEIGPRPLGPVLPYVLAIGPYPPNRLGAAVEALVSVLKREKLGVADLHNLFCATISHLSPPALFAVDPDLPVWD